MPLLLCGALLFVPLLVSRTRHDTTAQVVTTEQASAADLAERLGSDRSSRSVHRVLPEDEAVLDAETTTTTEAVEPTTTTTARVTTTTKPKAKVTTAAAKPKATTSTTRKPTTTTTTRPPNQQTGQASWYDTADGTCAHRTLAFGTILTVTNLDNGRQVKCRVADRGPYVEGRIVDLDKAAFEALAPASAGVIDVRIQW